MNNVQSSYVSAAISTGLHVLELLACIGVCWVITSIFPEVRTLLVNNIVGGVILDALAKFVRALQTNNVPDYVNDVNPVKL